MENPAALSACIRRAIAAALILGLALTIMPLGVHAEAFTQRVPAPDFATKVWLNSQPLTLKQLHGKVALIDFWEYTCINCIRTFPYLRRWQQLYAPAGLVIIGVHTPEFEFGKNPKNVADAVKRFGFTFPIAVDSDSDIWNAFHAGGWPMGLPDRQGRQHRLRPQRRRRLRRDGARNSDAAEGAQPEAQLRLGQVRDYQGRGSLDDGRDMQARVARNLPGLSARQQYREPGRRGPHHGSPLPRAVLRTAR